MCQWTSLAYMIICIYIYIVSLYVYVLSPCKSLHASLRVRKQEVAPGLHNIHFHRVFRVAPIGWKEHCFWRWALVHILCSQLQPPFSEVSYPILSSGWCVCVCLLCPDLVRSSWDLVLVPFCLPPRIRENWASKPSCSLQRRAGKQTRQMPNQKGHSPKRNHQRGRPATQKVRSKTKISGTEKKSDQILEDIIAAFALAKPQESLSKSSCRVALSFDFWGMVQLAFHGVLQILDFSFYKVEHEIIGVP